MTHEEFFKRFHDQVLRPTNFGENVWSFTVEELYQAIKGRLFNEPLEGNVSVLDLFDETKWGHFSTETVKIIPEDK